MLIEDTKMDWNTLYCPNKGCQYYGIPFRLGKLVKNGFNHGQPQALCKACGGSVVLSYATAYYGLESEPAIFETAVRALAEGNSIRATGRIFQIDKDTVCDWLDRAALHCRSVALYLWSQLHVTECQLDELWGFVHTKEAHLPCAKIYSETYGDAWVQFKVQYYIYALVFVLFDIESVFLFPWAVIYNQLPLFAVLEMVLFILILTGALVYAWRKGDLEWV